MYKILIKPTNKEFLYKSFWLYKLLTKFNKHGYKSRAELYIYFSLQFLNKWLKKKKKFFF